jgi:hypothetical protein
MASAPHPVAPVPTEQQIGLRAARVDFLGIGAQKAGTTWLHQMLGAHPEVFMARAEDKDLRFFSAYYDCGYEWYESHFAEDDGAKRRGEFSTSYFYSQDAPERVHRYNPSMQLILSLRDPVSRLISHHKHEIRVGRLSPNISLERGLENNPSYVEQSMYFTQLSRWLEHFPLSSFHIVIFEDLFLDPERALRTLFDFIGVAPSFVPEALHEKVNEGRVPRSRWVESGVRLSASALRVVGAGWVVDSLKKARVNELVRAGNTRSASETEVNAPAIERLRAMFAPENAKLARLLGRDLSVWTGGPAGLLGRKAGSRA